MNQVSILMSVRAIIERDLRLAVRRKSEAVTGLAFYVIIASLFPLGIGPEADTLRQIAPGVLWVAALLASLLSLNRLFEQDYLDGTLEQMCLTAVPLPVLAIGKVTAHWLLFGLPLTVLAPFVALQFDMPAQSIVVLALSLLLGTPILSLLGAVGAALTLGLRGGGVLVALLVLPLCIPVLIFGAGAVEAHANGLDAGAHLSLLGAILIVSACFSPLVTTIALRIAIE
jgi:heme exporter protein B